MTYQEEMRTYRWLFWLYSPGGSCRLCILGCPGEVWGSLGGNIWGVRDLIPPGPATTVAAGRGAKPVPGVTAGCGADCITAVGASALMMFDPALTGTILDGGPLFTSEVCMPIPVWTVVLATTAWLALLLPFKVAHDPEDCIGGLTSVTVGPAVWVTGWAAATTLCEFTRGVWITLFDEGGIIVVVSSFDNTAPLLTAVTDTPGSLLLPVTLVTAASPTETALPELWEFIDSLPLEACTGYELTFLWWLGKEVASLLPTSVLPGSCPVVESVLAVDASIVVPWGLRWAETPCASTCSDGAKTILSVVEQHYDTSRGFLRLLWRLLLVYTVETKRKTTLLQRTCFSNRLDQVSAGH